MADLINKDKLRQAFDDAGIGGRAFRLLMDAPHIGTCKGCKHCWVSVDGTLRCDAWKTNGKDPETRSDWFCSRYEEERDETD